MIRCKFVQAVLAQTVSLSRLLILQQVAAKLVKKPEQIQWDCFCTAVEQVVFDQETVIYPSDLLGRFILAANLERYTVALDVAFVREKYMVAGVLKAADNKQLAH